MNKFDLIKDIEFKKVIEDLKLKLNLKDLKQQLRLLKMSFAEKGEKVKPMKQIHWWK